MDYISNKDLLATFIRWRSERGRFPSRLPIEIAQAAIQIVDHLAQLPQFKSYSFLSDMKQAALLDCVRGAARFDPARSRNPWAYLNAICWNCFRRVIRKETKFLRRSAQAEVSPEIPAPTQPPSRGSRLARLDAKELRVTRLAAEGTERQVIAKRLRLAPDAVSALQRSAARKLGTRRHMELIRLYREEVSLHSV